MLRSIDYAPTVDASQVEAAVADAMANVDMLTAAEAQAAADTAIGARVDSFREWSSDGASASTEAHESWWQGVMDAVLVASTVAKSDKLQEVMDGVGAAATASGLTDATTSILAAVGEASTLTQPEVEAACVAALTAAGIPASTAAIITQAYVQAACAAALAAYGTSTLTQAQVQALIVNATSQAAYQAGAAAAIAAASLATAAQVSALNNLSQSQAQTAAAAAITAAGLQNSAGIQAAVAAALTAFPCSTLTQAQAQAACTASINALLGTPVRINGVFSGAGTSSTIIAAPGANLKIALLSVTCSVGGAVTTGIQLTSTGGDSTSSHNIAVGGSVQFGGDSFIPVLVGGTNQAYNLVKTTLATVIYDVRYRII